MFQSSADHFFTGLTRADGRLIRSAQKIFLTQSFLNLLLYYTGFGVDGKNTKFPATISFTIRGGIPMYSNLIVWTAGWGQMFRVLLSKGDTVAKIFAGQMYLVGLSTVYLFPVGSGGVLDQIHGAFAGLYFVYHVVLFKYLRTRTPYQVGFYASFATFLFALKNIRKMEVKYQFRSESNSKQKLKCDDYEPSTKTTVQKDVPKNVRTKLWWNEFMLMISENTMFVSFLVGMTSSMTHLLR
jgi:hypothetical protein